MGTIRQLKNGKFVVSVYDTTGKRHRIWFGEKKYADAFVKRIESEKSEQKLVSVGLINKRSTVEEAIESFMKSKTNLKDKSVFKYDRAFGQFKIFCSNHRIAKMNEFTRDNADSFWSIILNSNTTSKTMNFYLMVVKALFQFEVKRDRLNKSPFSHIKGEKEKIKSMIEREGEYYDRNEIKAFFKVEMENKHRQAFTVLFLTGFRISEFQSLTWERSVDLENKLIKLRKYDGYDTKTDSSERNIPMTNLVYDIITDMKGKDSTGYLFKSKDGGKVSERTLLTKCKLIAQKAGITKNATLHMWRHSFASHTIDTNIQYEERQYLLGHTPESMTDRYTKIDPISLQEELSKLDELIK